MKQGNTSTQTTTLIENTGLPLHNDEILHPPSIPASFIEEPIALARLKKALLSKQDSETRFSIVLYGNAGSGKSTLAAHATADAALNQAYPDGVYWLDIGPKPYDLPEQVNQLGQSLIKDWQNVNTQEKATRAIQQILEAHSILLILDDVCTVKQALQWQSRGPSSHVLMTTRNEHVAEVIRAAQIPSNSFSPRTSIEFLGQTTPLNDKQANKLASALLNMPAHLSMAGLLIDAKYDVEALIEAAKEQKPSQLQTFLLAEYLNRQSEAERMLTVSLSILPARIPIPVSAIHLLWHKLETEYGKVNHLQLIDQLVDLGIIRKRTHAGRVSINDALFELAEDHYEELTPLWHEALLTAYNRDQLPWPELPDDGYLYRFLCYHLSETSNADQLPALLLSFEWLQAKLNYTNVDALFDDFNFVREDKTLRVIQEALRLSSNILSTDPDQLGSQLIGRLQELQIPAIRDLVDTIKIAEKPEPIWLEPFKVNLDIPGSALLQSYRGHDDVIHAIDIEWEGRKAISASSDQTLKLWDLRTGAQLRTFKGHHDLVHSVAFTKNGKYAISGSDDLTLKVWDIESGSNLRTYALHDAKILAIEPLSDNQRVISADEAGKLILWDLWEGHVIREFDTSAGRIWSITVAPENNAFFTAGDDQRIECWSLNNKTSRQQLSAHDDWIWSLKLTPDGRYLISASEDETIIVWDLFSGQVARVFTGHQAGVRAIDLSRDGKTLVSASEDQSMIVWDFEQGKILRTFTGHDDWVWDMAITPDGKGVLSASDDSSLKLWSLTGHTFQIEKEAHRKGVRALAISQDNTFLLSGSDDTSLKKWRLNDARVDQVFQGHSDWVWDVAITSKGRYAVSTSFDCSINVWDLEQEKRRHILNGHDDWVWCAKLSWNNKMLISGSEDKTVGIWDMEAGRLLNKLRGHSGGVTAVALSNDNRLVISASLDHTLRVWRLDNGQCLQVLKGHKGPVRTVLISQVDQRVISSSDDGTIRIWNYNTGAESACLKGHTAPIRHIELTPLGYNLISAGEDKVIKIWDLALDQIEYELKGHEKDIRQIAMSRDGRLLATAGDDHALFLWDIVEGKRIGSFYADYPLTRCIFTIDGLRIVAGDAGGGIHFLKIDEIGFG